MSEPGHDGWTGAATRRRMLCSGTGGPRKAGVRVLTCPVCGKDDFRGYPDTRRVVPRHFVNLAASGVRGTATAPPPLTNKDAGTAAVLA